MKTNKELRKELDEIIGYKIGAVLYAKEYIQHESDGRAMGLARCKHNGVANSRQPDQEQPAIA